MRGLVPALFVRGETQRLKGYYDEALATFGEARALLEHSGDDDLRLSGEALRHIGVTHGITGDLDAAVVELEEARRLLEQVGDLNGISNACNTLAQCYSRRGEPLAALGALQRARSAVERAGNTFDLGLNLNNTGMLYYEMGEYEQALQVYERGLRVVRGTGDASNEAFMMAGSAETYRDMGRLEESLAMYQAARPMIEGLQTPELTAEFTEGLALTQLGLGLAEEAAQLTASVAPKPSDGPSRHARHALVQARVLIERGDSAVAVKMLDSALRRLEAANDRHGQASAAFLRARALFDSHQPRKAMAALENAAATCEILGFGKFLRPLASTATEMIEYARIRHVADALLADLVTAEQISTDTPAEAPTAAPGVLPHVQGFAFGRGSVMVGERQVSDLEWRSEKSKEMLFFMLARKEAVAKEDIFAALWPDLSDSKCNSNFHSSLYRLRRAVFHECIVRTTNGAYELNPRGVFTTDVDVFNKAMLEAEVARDSEARISALEQAVACYKGPFLVATYSEWTEPLRRELEDRYIEALNELAANRLRAGEFEEALTLFRLLEGVDPYSEASAFGIMRCHLGLNDGQSAARHFRRFKQLLKDELDEEPSARISELYQQASAS
jgi:DNA-binding SARP family transcriptional activator